MAGGGQPVNRMTAPHIYHHWHRLWPGLLAGLVLLMVGFGAVGAIVFRGGDLSAAAIFGDPYVLRVTRFTLMQATLSTLISGLLGLLVARALSRRAHWPGRGGLVIFMSLVLVIPTTVAASGLLSVWGRSGWINEALQAAGLGGLGFSIYGLDGLLLGHVFFNAPLMARVFLQALDAIPDAHWRQASLLGMGQGALFRIIEWPAIRSVLPAISAVVFLLCFTSFSLALMLGGGPAASTLEVVIYEAIRFDFDLSRAAVLSLWQLAICGGVLVLAARAPSLGGGRAGRRGVFGRPDARNTWLKLLDICTLLLFFALVGVPLIAVILEGVGPSLLALFGSEVFRQALMVSIGLGLTTAALVVALALAIGQAWRTLMVPTRLGGRPRLTWLAAGLDLASAHFLAVPAIVFGTGIFLLLSPVADLFAIAPLVVLAANVLAALPFALRSIQGRMTALAEAQDKQCAQLGIAGLTRFRLLEWPLMRREISFAAALSAAMSVGDLGVIALFGSDQFRTLPWLLFQKMNRYQSDEAASIALVLLLLSLGIFLLLDKGLGGRHAARR